MQLTPIFTDGESIEKAFGFRFSAHFVQENHETHVETQHVKILQYIPTQITFRVRAQGQAWAPAQPRA